MKYAITFCLLITGILGNTQSLFKNGLTINVSYGLSGNFQNVPVYNTQFGTEQIAVEQKYSIKARHYTFEYRRLFTSKHGIKASFGLANYGFGIKGELINAASQFNNTYKIRYLGWGLSYIHRVPIKDYGHILIEPGIRYHSDGSFTSNGISIPRVDAYSASIFAGYEFPMIGDHFYTNLGILIKAPLQSYSNEVLDAPNFYPYYFGLTVGFSYQF